MVGVNRVFSQGGSLNSALRVRMPDTALDAAEHSVAIKLQLMQPLVAGWWFLYKRSELGRDETR
jgi:hypothetical protein